MRTTGTHSTSSETGTANATARGLVRAWRLRVGIVVVLGVLVGIMSLAGGSAFAAGDANQGGCPNEAMVGFRVYLPDCRAYEMVTPPYKQGYPPTNLQFSGEGFSEGAPLVTGGSLGAFAGSPDPNSDSHGFSFSRTATGWVSVAQVPPAAQYVPNALGHQDLSVAIAGDGEALMVLRRPSESIWGSDLYRVDPGRGSPALVGPMLPLSTIPPGSPATSPSAAPQIGIKFASANKDLSHVLFYIEGLRSGEANTAGATNLWPGDTTVLGASIEGDGIPAASLYEYVGGGHSGVGSDVPSLVGVDNEGQLLSQCGIQLGGPQKLGSSYAENAISADGETVFFTPGLGGCAGFNAAGEGVTGTGPSVWELYARVGGRRTVAISEPSSVDCEECRTTVRESASYQGASSDGSKVFFTTSQELLPGVVGSNLYEYDFDAPAGHRVLLVSRGPAADVMGVAGISEDASGVYFVAGGVLAGKNTEGKDPVEGADNLYVALRRCAGGEASCASTEERLAFVATLTEADAYQWSAEGRQRMDVTADGRFLVFNSSADLTPDDTSTTEQVFRYDAETGGLLRVSIGNEGYNDNGNSTTTGAEAPLHQSVMELVSRDTHPAVSEDGSVVVFESPNALTPGALADVSEIYEGEPVLVENVYEYRAGHVYLISDGQTKTVTGLPNVRGSRVLGVSPSGEDIFFLTAGSLVAQDTDGLPDVYDARVGGGFPAPAAPAACEGDACQSPVDQALAPVGLGSVLSSGEPGVVAPSLVTPKSKPSLTRAQKLARALRACHGRANRRKRSACEAQARRLYGAAGKRRVVIGKANGVGGRGR